MSGPDDGVTATFDQLFDTGNSPLLDPIWKGEDTQDDASHGAFTFADDRLDGSVAVGRMRRLHLATFRLLQPHLFQIQ